MKNMKNIMKHFSAGEHLIQFNPETNVYKIRNTISKENHVISKEDFDKLNPVRINREQFSKLMNIYFKHVKHSWIYEGVEYRKLDNFELDGYNMCANYDYHKIPKHTIPGHKHFGNVILVYHWGKVYYFTFSYNGYSQGELIHPTTFDIVRWAKPKHCAPIFNINTKQIV